MYVADTVPCLLPDFLGNTGYSQAECIVYLPSVSMSAKEESSPCNPLATCCLMISLLCWKA